MEINLLRTTEEILSTIPIKIGRVYYCQDTYNLYFDTKLGRIPQKFTLLKTEIERKSIKNPVSGYNYVIETNSLWIFSGNKWRLYVKNEDNRYPSEYTDTNTNTRIVMADSFELLVNKDANNPGSLIINPESTVELNNYEEDNESYKTGKILELIKTHEYGKMIFNGEIYLRNNGITRKVCDDGCLEDYDVGDPPQSQEE